MVDYSKLSDFEINCEVAKVNEWTSKSFVHEVHSGKWNPCQNPADAWPIIVDSKISLHHSICKWDADSLVYDKKYKDGFFIFSSCSDIGDISSRGALRAAMIVFLMMQDAKNG